MAYKPKPFVKPSIDLGGGPKRTWNQTPVEKLQVGDMIQYAGKIVYVATSQATSRVCFSMLNGTKLIFEEGETLFAFTAANG